MKETSIVGLLKPKWPDVTIDRIESIAGAGIADCSCCHESGREFWIELKMLDSKGQFELRPSQAAWHVRRRLFNSATFVLARSEKHMELSVLANDMRTWRVLFKTCKPFDARGILYEILKFHDSLKNKSVL